MISRITGNSSRLPFGILFSLRSHVASRPLQSAFCILAIAISVTMATSLEMSVRGVQRELGRTADAISGAAKLQITNGDLLVPETLLEKIKSVPGIRSAAPLIEETFRVRGGPLDGKSLHVLGIDLLAEDLVREYEVTVGELKIRDAPGLMAELESVIASRALLKELGLKEFDRIPVQTEAGPLDLMVRGVVEPGGIGDAYGGQIIGMDIYSLQVLMDRVGWFDRIDVVPSVDADISELSATLSSMLDGVASVHRAQSRNQYVEQAFGTIRLAIWIIALIGIVVASLLTYGAISISVDERAEELALLQSAGLEPTRVRRLVRIDAFVLAIIGTVIGCIAATFLAPPFFAALSEISQSVSGARVANMQLMPQTFAVAAVVGMVISLLASYGPSRRATALLPLELVGSGSSQFYPAESKSRTNIYLLSATVLLWVFGLIFGSSLSALIHVGLLMGGGLILAMLILSRYLPSIIRFMAPRFATLFSGVGAFVGSGLLFRPTNSALTVGAVAGITAGLTSIFVLVSSIDTSVTQWIASRYNDGVLITTEDPFGTVFSGKLGHSDITIVRSSIGDVPILETYGTTVLFQGQEVLLTARTMSVLADHGSLAVLDRTWKGAVRELMDGKVLVSESFSRYFDLAVGDSLELDSPKGKRKFEIAGLVRDYFGLHGSIHIDIAHFDRYWIRRGAALVIFPDQHSTQLQEQIQAGVGSQTSLFFTHTDTYAQWSSRKFGEFLGLLYMVCGLAALLGGLAIFVLMVGVVARRRRELALFRLAGAVGNQVSGIVFLDGFLLAVIGVVLGLGLGILGSQAMCNMLTESMGWTVERTILPGPVSILVLIVLGVGAVSSAYPALLARRIGPVDAFGAG